MQIIRTLLTFIVLYLAGYPVAALERPKIGLVLSGGGARGAAHVGVLKVLEEMKIPIDVLAGTSMGSIVGGLYASGMTPLEIETALQEMDWDEVLTDDQSRQYLSINRKRQQDLFTTNLNPGFSDGRIRLPPGLIQGQKIELALQRFTSHVAHITNFDDLVIPFRAVATDIVAGEPVVLAGGSLANAMRASMSVPSLFSPFKIDGRLLVDGGVTNNLPVDVAKQMGAEILIVIDISTPLRDETQLGNLLAITDQLTRLLTGQNTRASRESLTNQDILIIPDLGDITSSQFDRSQEAILIGETEARNHAQDLSRLSVSDSEYKNYRSSLKQIAATEKQILKITLHNQSRLGDAVIEARINLQVEEALDLNKIEDDIDEIYGLGVFEKVGYNLHQHQDGVDVDIYTTPKSWGPNYLHFGFEMDGDLQGDNGTNVTLGYTRSAMNSFGGEWTSLLQIGEEPKIQSYFHQPLGRNLAYFIEPYISISRENFGLFTNDGEKFAEFRLKQLELEFAVGREFGTRAAISLGLSRTTGKAEILIGSPLLPEADFDDGGVFLRFNYDTLDNINFPTTGGVIRTSLYSATESMGARQDYQQWQFLMAKVKTYGRHTLVFSTILGGTENGPASLPRLFSLGGFFQLSGLKPNQRSGQYVGLLRTAYYRRFGGIKILPAYIGATAEYGGAWLTRDEISRDTTTFGGSIFVGLDSPAGPVLFGLGYTNEGDTTFFTKIGRFF